MSGSPINPIPPHYPPPQPASQPAALTPLSPAQYKAVQENALKESYLYRLVKGLDEFGNVVADGNLGQSISSRIGLDAEHGHKGAQILAEALGIAFHNPEHVVDAIAADNAQAQKVVDATAPTPQEEKQ